MQWRVLAALGQVVEEGKLLAERAAREARMEEAIVRARMRLEHEERTSWPARLEQAALAVRPLPVSVPFLSSSQSPFDPASYSTLSLRWAAPDSNNLIFQTTCTAFRHLLALSIQADCCGCGALTSHQVFGQQPCPCF